MTEIALGTPLQFPSGYTDRLAPGASLALVGDGATAVLEQLAAATPAALILSDLDAPLHPGYSVGEQIAAAIGGTRRAALDAATDLLELAGVPDPHQRVNARPHRLSPLDRQRAQIALALANQPALVLARDPTAGLSTTDAITLAVSLRRLWRRLGFALLLAGSERAIAERVVDEMLILQDGRVVQRRRRQPAP